MLKTNVNNPTDEENHIESEQLESFFRAMVADRCRYVLYHLREHRRTSLDDLVVQIAAWERERPRRAIDADVCERIHLELHHSHLPRLGDTPVADYDPKSRIAVYDDPPVLLDAIVAQCKAAELHADQSAD